MRIAVIIPVLNDAPMLEQCLAALARQTRPADEIVVVDNGSTDDTAEVARRFGARVVVEPERGIPQATAAGMDAAVGDLLCRLDADSVVPRDWIRRVERAFLAEPQLEVLSGPGRFYGGSGFVHWFAENVQFMLYDHVIGLLLGHDVVFGSNLAMRSDAWREIRGRVHRHRADVHDDLDIAINLPPGMRVRYDPELLVGASARPWSSWRRFGRSLAMAFRTLGVNGQEQSYLERRRAYLIARHAEDEGFETVAF